MKSVPKMIRRFVGILLLSSVLLIVLNLILIAIIASGQQANASPWKMAEEAAAAIQTAEDGFVLSESANDEIRSQDAWAILIDNSTLKVVWHSDDLPDTVPMEYTISDVADFTRGYINGYPTFTAGTDNGLMVVGYPPDSFWKHMWPSWDYQLIAHAPQIALSVIAVNLAVIFTIYVTANVKVWKSVKPITNGIQALSTGDSVYVKEKGLLSEVAFHINRTSAILQSQKAQLRKKETARANWIAGVSHDIRTPLSMVMGYADQLQSAEHLTADECKMAAVILKQSERMQNLINDLNLASKLEYNMQPIRVKQENAVAIVRQVAVDFINTDIDDKYSIEWLTEEELSSCLIHADRDLLKRAVSNLIQNCINHNENGCTIYISVAAEQNDCVIRVEDDGVGASDQQIEQLNTAPHYMVCDTNTAEQRHGLGLLIVKQIVAAHNGATVIEHSRFGGFSVKLVLPTNHALSFAPLTML